MRSSSTANEYLPHMIAILMDKDIINFNTFEKFPENCLINRTDSRMDKSQKTRKHHRRRTRIEDRNKPKLFRNAEQILSRNLFKILGGLLILASLWFTIRSADVIIETLKKISSMEQVLQVPESSPVSAGTIKASPASAHGSWVWFWGAAVAAVMGGLILLSGHFRRREIPRIVVPVFYASLFLLTRHFGWFPHMVFPAILLITILLHLNAIHLHSTMACKMNAVFAWLFFMLWWVLKIIIGGNPHLILTGFLYSFLIYLVLFFSGLLQGFHGYHRSWKFTEAILVVANILFFFLLNAVVITKFGWTGFLWLFAAGTGLQIILSVFFTEKLEYHRGPYLVPAIILLSLVIPLLAGVNTLILFSGILSALLMAYARFSKEQYPVIASLALAAIMVGYYLYTWIFTYFPLVFIRFIEPDGYMMIRGLIAGIMVIVVLAAGQVNLKATEISLSRKWFSRRTYLKLIRGSLLIVSYLTAFWLFHFLIMLLVNKPQAVFLSWFIFSGLFFIVVFPILKDQRSTFLNVFLWTGIVVIMVYPALVHLYVVELRNAALLHENTAGIPFYLHYVAVLFILIIMITTSRAVSRRSGKISVEARIIRTLFLFFGLFLLLSEYDHLTVVAGIGKGRRIEDIILVNRKLPYTIITLVYGLVILMTGFFRSDRLLRILALIILPFAIIKLGFYDAGNLSAPVSILLMFAIGTLLLVLSIFYPSVRRYFEHKPGQRHTHHRHRRQIQREKVPATAISSKTEMEK
jgi:hypothetical protein